jgi:hypothetical protein
MIGMTRARRHTICLPAIQRDAVYSEAAGPQGLHA